MIKLNVLIVDDEAGAREALQRLLDLFCPEVGNIVCVEDEPQALRAAGKEDFDVAFLDIELRQSNGLALAEKIAPYCAFIVFVTAYDKYAVEAFKTPATSYLLKPVIPKQLQETIRLIAEKKQGQQQSQRILLSTQEGLLVLHQKDIIRVQGDGNYCEFYCKNAKTYYLSKNLSHYAKQLSEDLFVRTHQSHLVNIHEIQGSRKQDTLVAIMSNGDEIPISVRRKSAFMAVLTQMNG